MKIKKTDRVLFLTDNDVEYKSFSASCTVAVSGGTGAYLRVDDGTKSGALIETKKVKFLILNGVPTAFSGTGFQLETILSADFFTGDGGGGTDDYNDLTNKPFTSGEVTQLKSILNNVNPE